MILNKKNGYVEIRCNRFVSQKFIKEFILKHKSLILKNLVAKLLIELIEYVVVHELAHIKYKHHQKPFWDEVVKFLPDVKIRRKNLRKYERMF